jgi:hypothetical protein
MDSAPVRGPPKQSGEEVGDEKPTNTPTKGETPKVPALQDLAGHLDQVRDDQEPVQPGSERCHPQPSPLDAREARGQRQGSARRDNEDGDSLESFQHDIQQLSEYGGGTLGKRASVADDPRDDGAAESQDGDDNGLGAAKQKRNRAAGKEYQEDNEFNLSDLEEDQRKELLELEMQIEKDNLTRGERRRLQNKRNVLKAKIKKELETEGHKSKISKLQKRVLQLKKAASQGSHYKEQRDALREENKLLKKQLRDLGTRIKQMKEQRQVYQTQILQQGNIVNQPNAFNAYHKPPPMQT